MIAQKELNFVIAQPETTVSHFLSCREHIAQAQPSLPAATYSTMALSPPPILVFSLAPIVYVAQVRRRRRTAGVMDPALAFPATERRARFTTNRRTDGRTDGRALVSFSRILCQRRASLVVVDTNTRP